MSILLKAHRKAKKKHPDAIVFLKIGLFIETFDEDAITTGEIAKIYTHDYQDHAVCGFPISCADKYIQKLEDAGYRVVVIDPRNH